MKNQTFDTKFLVQKLNRLRETQEKNELLNVSETPSESFGSKCSIIFSRNSKCGGRLLEPFMKRWPRVVSDPLTELMEQLPLHIEQYPEARTGSPHQKQN